ncbi:hypothetical protein BKP56_11775 [Marinilactibacillus sp. 15R]|uniref:DNA-binding transcriptional regulator, AcrR family n=1 Tax=Marinilactibacillus piezotolerans TaxID=258723 RepID=A0A1I3XBA2_9LACT|nr:MULTISPECIES: TetR/AcrR family transcriptional regulator [Marinilactibacillus]API89897.1 hypothetical protein BKP56_11775 [Marinilactibacillus sp. 15R]SFK16833.1 DNA-binding transcriptional regulator, AcrR family [Marinilactibacillus piezotolerans]
MPRQRTILRENILGASMELLRTSGFKQFTARQIAIKMNSSTQPIYKEFKNMEDLKIGLLDYVKQYLTERVYSTQESRDPLMEVCKNYILFAKNEPTLFSAIYMDREFEAVQLHDFAYDKVTEIIANVEEIRSESSINDYLDRLWPAIHGVAMLVAQGKIVYNNEEEVSRKVSDIIHASKETQY